MARRCRASQAMRDASKLWAARKSPPTRLGEAAVPVAQANRQWANRLRASARAATAQGPGFVTHPPIPNPVCCPIAARTHAAGLYQRALIMTHRDGFPRLSARSAWRGDAGHRKPCAPSESYGPSESLGKPPFRSRRRTGSGRPWGRRKALPMSRIARGFPPTRPLARRIARAISMGQYQRPLV